MNPDAEELATLIHQHWCLAYRAGGDCTWDDHDTIEFWENVRRLEAIMHLPEANLPTHDPEGLGALAQAIINAGYRKVAS